MSENKSHIQQAQQWLREHEAIPKEKCKYGCSQTVERCHAHQMKFGPCVFACEHRLNELDAPDYWACKFKFKEKNKHELEAGTNAR